MIRQFKWKQKQCATRLALLAFACAFAFHAHAAEPERGKKLDFDDSIVEGVNKKPLDSLAQISEGKNGKKKQHLYPKRTQFAEENKRTLLELRYSP